MRIDATSIDGQMDSARESINSALAKLYTKSNRPNVQTLDGACLLYLGMRAAADAANSYDVETVSNTIGAAMFAGLSMEHRTLQAGVFRGILEFLDCLTREAYHTDPRNEKVKELASLMLKGIDDHYAKSYGIDVRSLGSRGKLVPFI